MIDQHTCSTGEHDFTDCHTDRTQPVMSLVLDHSGEVVGRTDCQADEVRAPEARNAPQIWYRSNKGKIA